MSENFLDRREIGKTGLTTGRIGIGSTFDASCEVIESAFDRGVNYLYWGTVRQPDFAKAIRNLTVQHRDELVLTIQSYSEDPGTIEAEVQEALASGGIEKVDFLLLGNHAQQPHDGYYEVFEKMRDKGTVRFLSLSSHNRPMLPTLLEAHAKGETPIDLLMLRYNPVHRGAEKDGFPFVPETGGPFITTYTSTRWGHLVDAAKMPPGDEPVSGRDCYRYALSHPAVDMVTAGPANAEQMDQALAALEKGPLDADERERLERIGAHLYSQYAPQYPDQGDAGDVASGLAKGKED